jgi:GTPase SAR1 family protein
VLFSLRAYIPQVTYKNLDRWYKELEEYCPGIPTIVVANKIDGKMHNCLIVLVSSLSQLSFGSILYAQPTTSD